MIEQIIEAIESAENHGILENSGQEFLTGFSGEKIIGILQRLISLFSTDKNACYLEVGVFQGLTLLATASVDPNFSCYGIDNFAYFDPDKKNLSIVRKRQQKLGIQNAYIINKDYEDALENLSIDIKEKKVAVYFIDGPHDYRSQMMCLQLAMPYLHNNAVLVIDDCNYRHVRQANRDFLVAHPEYKLIFEAYTECHPKNMNAFQEQESRKSWWNGVNVLIRDRENRLSPMFPITERSRNLYENEHIIHSSSLAEFTPYLIDIFQSILDSNTLQINEKLEQIKFTIQKQLQNLEQVSQQKIYKTMNTYSQNLPKFNYNKPNKANSDLSKNNCIII